MRAPALLIGRLARSFVRERHWEIGIVLLPEWRGRGIGSRAQVLLCDYLFSHTPVQWIQAGIHPEPAPSR
jgi:RimJ/RimL family protein N-acetyltransferase